MFIDTASGAKADRPGLNHALTACQSGDILVVWKLDHLGRSLPHLVQTVRELGDRSVGFQSLREHIDTTSSGGRLVFHLEQQKRIAAGIYEKYSYGTTVCSAIGVWAVVAGVPLT